KGRFSVLALLAWTLRRVSPHGPLAHATRGPGLRHRRPLPRQPGRGTGDVGDRPPGRRRPAVPPVAGAGRPVAGGAPADYGSAVPDDDLIPSERRIYSWIEDIFARGVRRPGYPADRWAEDWLCEQFAAMGLEHVRGEPVDLPSWEPARCSLTIEATGTPPWQVDCFALPHCAPTAGTEAVLVPFDPAAPDHVRGAVALHDLSLMRMPHDALAGRATWVHDPGGTLAGAVQVLPFGREFMMAMEPAAAGGAVGFVGVLAGYPGDSKDYYLPYSAVARPLPGFWIRGRDDGGGRRGVGARGRVHARSEIEAAREVIRCRNVVGELPGADDETVIIGSHHDGPWASAVEDGPGIRRGLAPAARWRRL